MSQQYQGYGRLKPQKVMMEGIQFDSLFEADVYSYLLSVIPKSRILTHESIKLLDASDDFNELRWKCDFTVLSPDYSNRIYVEAKGLKTDSFLLLLRLIRESRPEIFSSLLLVMGHSGVKYGKSMKSLNITQMMRILTSLERTEWKS